MWREAVQRIRQEAEMLLVTAARVVGGQIGLLESLEIDYLRESRRSPANEECPGFIYPFF